MDLLKWVVFGVVPATAAMLIGVGVGGPRWLAISLAVAICVPFGMASGWPDWPWLLSVQNAPPRPWLWWLLLFAGVIGSAYDLRALPKAIAGFGEVVLLAALPWLLSGRLRADWSFEFCALILPAGWLLLAAIWLGLRKAARAHPGMAVPLALTIVLAVDAWLLRRNVGGSDWQLAGVAAVALGLAVMATLWRRPFVCGTGASLCVTIAHVGLLWCGRNERQLLQPEFLLALIAPLPMWLVSSRAFADSRTSGALCGVIGTALLGGLAVGFA